VPGPRPSFAQRLAAAALALLAVALAPRAARAAGPCGRLRFITAYDSHGLTTFGDRLDGWILGQKDAELLSYTLGGANPEWLVRLKESPRGYFYHSCDGIPILPRKRLDQRKLRAPSLADLLNVPEGTYEKQVVIVTMGSNVPGFPSVHTKNVEKIVRTIHARADAVCIWVGPPSMRAWTEAYAEKVYQAIRDGIAAAEDPRTPGKACHLIDSRPLSVYPKRGGDGWHYGFFAEGIAGGQRWADSVAHEIEKILRQGGGSAALAKGPI
jgi:hypothetical protein